MFIVHCFISSERKLLKETKKVEHKDTRACIIYTFYSYEGSKRGRILYIPFYNLSSSLACYILFDRWNDSNSDR